VRSLQNPHLTSPVEITGEGPEGSGTRKNRAGGIFNLDPHPTHRRRCVGLSLSGRGYSTSATGVSVEILRSAQDDTKNKSTHLPLSRSAPYVLHTLVSRCRAEPSLTSSVKITAEEKAGDDGAGLLTQVQGLAPAFDNTFLIGGKSKIRFVGL
jgi:hypothetical protein